MLCRALRTLFPGLGYIYSITVWVWEFISYILGNSFLLSMWYQVGVSTAAGCCVTIERG